MTLEELQEILASKEGENLEFKEAKNTYPFDELAKYCTALANEGGGKMVLGVTDKRPRRVVGSKAFTQPERTRTSLMERLRLRIFVPDGFENPTIKVLKPSAGGITKWLARKGFTPGKEGWIVKPTKLCF